MCIKSFDCPIGMEITEIRPASFSYGDRYIKKGKKVLLERTTDFRTHDKYSKRLYFAFKPMWYLMHALDWAMLDRVEALTKLSFGFSTLTVYPDASPTSTSFDGYAYNPATGTGLGQAWATAIAGAGAGSSDTATVGEIGFLADTVLNQWRYIYRAIFLFDTHTLTASATISAAVMSLFGASKQDPGSRLPTWDIYTSTPASNTSIANGDFAQCGSTSQTGSAMTQASWSASAYNDFTFNSTGRGNVSKTSISKFSLRNANYDVAASAPTWASGEFTFNQYNFADNTGTANDPKLVVTYTIAVSAGGAFLFNMI